MLSDLHPIRLITRLIALILLVVVPTLSTAQADEEEKEGGILGTGIVGMVTLAGNVVINGENIIFDRNVTLTSQLVGRGAGQLETGEVVAAVIRESGNDWHAQSLTQIHPIIGPVTHVDGNEMTVMGTTIRPRDKGVDLVGLRAGDWIAVSGFWQFDQLVATHIRAIDPQPLASLQGSVLPADNAGMLRIGGAVVTGVRAASYALGDVVQLRGTPHADGLFVSQAKVGLFTLRPSIVQSQGYLSPAAPDGFYTLLGSGSFAYTDTPQMIDPQRTVTQCAVGRQLVTPGAVQFRSPERARIAARLGC